jgi:hypothetical protein
MREPIEFILLCVCATVAFIGFLLWAHIRQVSNMLKVRHEARLAERDRIARDMHDTLLQSTEGLILKVYAAVQQLPLGDPTRAFEGRSFSGLDDICLRGWSCLRHSRHSASNCPPTPQQHSVR